ncbi:ubiquinone/menaquinone biosynthesis C-methyltransferase UbiE-like [Xenia sp. Carnegie-2017]|uniref:ubiquinone/menaquinone biosynthesis C-methyltransferase UbiE-like n=1 Tax=Xenia sp. Carnegie-2017 TaxID=2897299 RepID=UPI001F049A03|nr:ubiquinone/menaquinone biosynthesis C-methyltransferase UbiE-like [Xenia sp. Carnegie-2017]
MKTSIESVFNKRSFEAAVEYSKNNNVQIECGKKLATNAGIKRGDKILDMGCGTGELTSFLSEIVGRDGLVVGVDPDFGRIQYAKQRYLNMHGNLLFEHGDSSINFTQRNKSYYDVHFSNFVIQWLSPERKEEFGRVAFRSLKHGGRIAVLSHEGDQEMIKKAEEIIFKSHCSSLYQQGDPFKRARPFFINKSETESLLIECGFEIFSSEYHPVNYTYASILDFINFLVASDYKDGKKISSSGLNKFMEMFGNVDGSVGIFDPTVYQIVAHKI